MANGYRDQLQRIDRLMAIVESDNFNDWINDLEPIDIVVFACQSMWHLKDWILNDPCFGAKNRDELNCEIHASRCLCICADLANGSKHLTLNNPRTDARLSDRYGFQLDTSKEICRVIYYVWCDDQSDEYHGMEIRDFLRICRDQWQRIIHRHHLSKIGDDWTTVMNDIFSD